MKPRLSDSASISPISTLFCKMQWDFENLQTSEHCRSEFAVSAKEGPTLCEILLQHDRREKRDAMEAAAVKKTVWETNNEPCVQVNPLFASTAFISFYGFSCCYCILKGNVGIDELLKLNWIVCFHGAYKAQ